MSPQMQMKVTLPAPGSTPVSAAPSPWMTPRQLPVMSPCLPQVSRVSSTRTAVPSSQGSDSVAIRLCERTLKEERDGCQPGDETPTAARYLQVCAELERTKQQLAEEQEFTARLKEMLITQHEAYTKEVSTLHSTNDQLRVEVLDLIEDLETTLRARPSSRSRIVEPSVTLNLDALETDLSVPVRSTPGAAPAEPWRSESGIAELPASAARSAEKGSFYIPNWNEITRHISKTTREVSDDDLSDSQLTRCGSSLSSTTSLSETASQS